MNKKAMGGLVCFVVLMQVFCMPSGMAQGSDSGLLQNLDAARKTGDQGKIRRAELLLGVSLADRGRVPDAGKHLDAAFALWKAPPGNPMDNLMSMLALIEQSINMSDLIGKKNESKQLTALQMKYLKNASAQSPDVLQAAKTFLLPKIYKNRMRTGDKAGAQQLLKDYPGIKL